MRRGPLLLGALSLITALGGAVAVVRVGEEARRQDEARGPVALVCPGTNVRFSRSSVQPPPIELGPAPRFPRLLRLSDAAVIGVVREVTTRWNLRPGERPSISREYRYPTIYRRIDIEVDRWLFPEGMDDRMVTLTVEGGNRSYLLRPDEVRQINRLNPGSIPPGERRAIRSEPWGVHFDEGERVALLLLRWRFPFATGKRNVLTVAGLAYGKYLIDAGCVLRNPVIRFAHPPARLGAPRTLPAFVAAVRDHLGAAATRR